MGMKQITFHRAAAAEILRYTSLNITHVSEDAIEAWATLADIETFKLNGWWFEFLTV